MCRLSLTFFALVVSSAVVAWSADAVAQAAPDVVMLREGGMLRGWILESVPGEQVTIRLLDGRTRSVEWAGVSYAGPESARPRASASAEDDLADDPPPDPPSVEVPVRVRATDSDLTLYRRGEFAIDALGHSQTFERLCAVPCEVTLPPGQLDLAVARGSGKPVLAPLIELPGPGTLELRYFDRNGVRVAGWVVFILSMVALPPTIIGLVFAGDPIAATLSGIGVGVGGVVISLPMVMLNDGASIEFE